jgi:alkaline phosphatase
MKTPLLRLLILLLVLPTSTGTAAPLRNVILIIGDGFDDQHVTMGRNYLAGMSGTLRVDQLAFRAAVQVETLSVDGLPVYVADSANTATALATGTLTSIGRIGTNINDQDAQTIAELAMAAGLRVGLVTTSSITDATPAAFLSHVSARSCEGPDEILGSTYYGIPQPACPQDARDNGGPGSIIEQLITSGAHVLLGGGQKFLNQTTIEGKKVHAVAEAEGFQVISDASALAAVDPNTRLLGVFDEETLPVRWRGTDGRTAEAAETSWLNQISDYLGEAKEPMPIACEANPDYGNTPSVAAMTEAALRHLSKDNAQGFFLMVESASIDKQSHKRDPCGSIGEIAQLEEALALATTFSEAHPDTLIIVTADHAQAAQILPEPSLYDKYPIPIYSPGLTARVQTPEGGLMRVNYATSNGFSEEHTGANVPLFSNEAGRSVLRPFMRQRDVHQAMRSFLLNDQVLSPGHSTTD